MTINHDHHRRSKVEITGDWFFGIVAAIAMIAFVLFLFVVLAYDPKPWRYVGVPAGATCGYESHSIETCVADGRVYLCVLDWRDRVVQCARHRQ